MGKAACFAIIAAAMALGGCGDDDRAASVTVSTRTEPAGNASTGVQKHRCTSPSQAAVTVLKRSLAGGRQLYTAGAVPSADTYRRPAEIREGAIFVAAKLDDEATVLWLAEAQFVRTGEGVVVAASAGTRRLSSLGADLNPDEIGISSTSRGLREVRECVRKRAQSLASNERRARPRAAARKVSCGAFSVGRANSTAYRIGLPARGSVAGTPCRTLKRVARRLQNYGYTIPEGAFANAPDWGARFSLRDQAGTWRCEFQSHGLSGPSYVVRCNYRAARLRWRVG